MKKLLIAIIALIPLMTQALPSAPNVPQNPFDGEFQTVHGTAPFSKITNADYEPAIDKGLESARREIEAITSNPEAPTFENTIEALERTGSDLNRVLNIFFPLLSADADDEMMDISIRISPKLSDYSTSIILNEDLWKRVKAVYDNRESLKLSTEQQTLLQKTYDSFALSGANLQGEDREKYRAISSELSELTTKFGQNVLKLSLIHI